MMKKIAVFCSASNEIDPKYNKVAREFVEAASLRGYGVVTGGTVKGTMGVVSDALRDCGGYHLGVIPRFMEQYVYPELSEVIWTDTMAAFPCIICRMRNVQSESNIFLGNTFALTGLQKGS